MSHRRNSQRHLLVENLLPWLLVILSLAASRLLLPIAEVPTGAALQATIYASVGIGALPLFLNRHNRAHACWLVVAPTTSVIVTVMLLIDPLTRGLTGLLPALLITMLMAASSVVLLIRVVQPGLLCVLLMTLTLAPVWAAPLVELAGNPVWLSRLVVSASPLTVFSVSLELDYLRTPWFYAHSAIGSMRYDYPDALSILICLSLLPSAAVISRLLDGTASTSFRISQEAHS